MCGVIQLRSKALAIGVVNINGGGALVAKLPRKPGQYDALGRVRYCCAEEEVVILYHAERG